MLQIPTDPMKMDRWLSTQHTDEPPAADRYLQRQAQRSELERLMRRLPRLDRDILDLRYQRGKTVADIGAIFGVTQQAMSLRLSLAREKIAFLSRWAGTDLTEKGTLAALSGLMTDRDARMVWRYLDAGSCATVARSFNLSKVHAGRTLRMLRVRLGRSAQTDAAKRVHAAMHELLLAGRRDLLGARRSLQGKKN